MNSAGVQILGTVQLSTTTQLTSVGGDIQVKLGLGRAFVIYDRTAPYPGNTLLRVTEDGTYHIKTGASWVADL